MFVSIVTISLLKQLQIPKHIDFSFKVDVIIYEKFKFTPPLIFAVQCGSTDVLAALIEHGMSVWQADEFDNTALHWAARLGLVKCVELLTNNHIFLEINIIDFRIPLMEAACHGHTNVVKYVLTNTNAPIF